MAIIKRLIRRYKKSGLLGTIQQIPSYMSELFYPRVKFGSWLFEQKRGEGIDVVKQDWDNLIILDACRYDEFASECSLKGNLNKTVSKGKNSIQYIERNYNGRELHDTVYVTANPYVKDIKDGVFHAIVDDPLKKNFDERLGTVRPEEITRAAIEAHDKYPNKRLIIHYMQPHMPPIGEIRDLMDDIDDGFDMTGEKRNTERTYNLVKKGLISPDSARLAYRQNLRIVLKEVANLSQIGGKTVISSDHGELLGDSHYLYREKLWSHGLTRKLPKTEELCIVPWFEWDISTDRRKISSDPPVQNERITEENARDQLEGLGYL
jgi:hypothetical protein